MSQADIDKISNGKNIDVLTDPSKWTTPLPPKPTPSPAKQKPLKLKEGDLFRIKDSQPVYMVLDGIARHIPNIKTYDNLWKNFGPV